MKTNENGDPLPHCSFDASYDPTVHDGEIEGPVAVWMTPEGSVWHTEDDLTRLSTYNRPPDMFSVYLHCRAGGTDCVCDTETAAQAETFINVFKSAITKHYDSNEEKSHG